MAHDFEPDADVRRERDRVARKRIIGGREISEIDHVWVGIVSGLVAQIEEVRTLIERDGVLVNGEAHPGFDVQRKASQEIRGWIERRPDLFGGDKIKGQRTTKTQKDRFKHVLGM
ncbi:hypothetical protein EAH68_12760 [Corynebacterium hylobatis]|uniref:Terminase n=1 Tax=Corynebacterium hylobatis TaxID=1859290 RepID=A0A3S0BEW1_9CORY|nr:hypothetical protein [Corynebacterium hylobatis]RSZ61528.1 hypothetical protein EAH68_12760 [Corynebacterium hylobatis]